MNTTSSPRRSSGGQQTRGGRSGAPQRNRHASRYQGSSGGRGRNNRSNGGGRRRQNIDPKRFVKSAKPSERVDYVPEHKFADFALAEVVQTNLDRRGFTSPTQIQDQSIKAALAGSDVVGIANTGTGKTAAFLLPLLTKLTQNRGQKAIILAPTRELALQIQEESRTFTRGTGLYDTLLIGGTPFGRQLRDLQRSPEIIIGTPGRIKDHLERGTLKLDDVSSAVLDEVDRMLDMGFINDIRTILSQLPSKRQSLFYSATMSNDIARLIQTFTNDPVTIQARTAETSDSVEQTVMNYSDSSDKLQKLRDLLIEEGTERTLIFCETKRGSDKLTKQLDEYGFKVDAMHGNKSQSQRQRALRKFKGGEIDMLVATDVAARGIDVDEVTHVINYDLPQSYDDYTHRIGRAGRGGSLGTSVTFIESRSSNRY